MKGLTCLDQDTTFVDIPCKTHGKHGYAENMDTKGKDVPKGYVLICEECQIYQNPKGINRHFKNL